MNEFDPSKIVQDGINSGFDPSSVEEMDERQLDWAKNVSEWITDAKYMGIKTIYPLQYQVALKLFGDVCPWCSDWKFYQNDFDVSLKIGDIQDRVQLLEDGKCPKCAKTKLDQFKEGYWHQPHELDLLWGMRAGKSAIAGIIGSYVLHRYLRIPDPSLYFRQLKGSVLTMRFIALTMSQAKETNWMQFTRAVEATDWFGRYHDFLKYFEKKQSVEMVRWLSEKFEYTHKGIMGYPYGASIDTSRGRTAIFTAFDEMGWWLGTDNSKRANPHETYLAYEKAARTVRNVAMSHFLSGHFNVPTSWIMSVSSTSSKADYIMRLVKKGKTDNRRVTSHKASWEVNPDFIENPRELEHERQQNPKAFSRDFGSIPPFTDEPFIDSEEAVLKIAKLPQPEHGWNVETLENDVGLYLSAEKMESQKNTPYCLALDLGYNDCGYAASLLRLKEEDFSVTQVVGQWSIYPTGGKVVDLDGTFHSFVEKLCEKMMIKLVIYDRWNSKAQIQSLTKLGVKAIQYSLTYKDFVAFRTQIMQGKLEAVIPEIPLNEVEASPDAIEDVLYPRPYLHFLWQTLSVSEIGSKITKTGDGHDDLFRTVVLGARFLWDEDYKRLFEYRGGIVVSGKKGKFVGYGMSSSGQQYTAGNQYGGNVATVNRNVLGGVSPRSKRSN